MTTHTPGPWTEDFGFISAPLTPRLATIRNRADGANVTEGEYHANARLIAAAPEMLQTIKRAEQDLSILLTALTDGPVKGLPKSWPHELGYVVKDIRALLARIEGGK